MRIEIRITFVAFFFERKDDSLVNIKPYGYDTPKMNGSC
jgi:hypothetical protein